MEPGRVYVVDDDPDVRRSLAFLLEAHRLECQAFPDGEAFLVELETLRPGCILLDLRLPRRSGLEVQGELARRGNYFPIIVMSGAGDLEAEQEALELGALDLLHKPFSEGDLFAALRRSFLRLGSERN